MIINFQTKSYDSMLEVLKSLDKGDYINLEIDVTDVIDVKLSIPNTISLEILRRKLGELYLDNLITVDVLETLKAI